MGAVPEKRPESLFIGFGNKKLGLAWTFSLPSKVTCPGASEWCKEHCYAWRLERFRPNCRRAYLENLALSADQDKFVRLMLDSLPEDAGVFRIHVGGDFYSTPYCESWIRICRARPDIQFWTYTRSWTDPEIRGALEQLWSLPNVEVFASTDETMPLPPEGWRIAFVDSDPRAQGMPCKEQQDRAESCLACQYCFQQHSGNVVFRVH